MTNQQQPTEPRSRAMSEQELKPVHQTIFEPPLGDCWAACIATIMALPLADVPNFAAWYSEPDCDHDAVWRRYLTWIAERGWLVMHWQPPMSALLKATIVLPSNTPVMATVKSPNGDWNHCVVANFVLSEVLHDPRVGGAPVDLSTVQDVELLLPATGYARRSLARRAAR